MQWSDISFQPTTKTLRQFAGLFVLFFGGMAIWQFVMKSNPTAATYLAIPSIAIGLIGLWQPRLLRPIYVGWMVLAFPIGWTVSRILLGILFFGIFTPIAFWFRLIGREPLERGPRPELPTYWVPKPMPDNVRRYFRQF